MQYDAALSGSAESMDKAESAADFYTQSLADQETQIQESAEALDALIQSMVDAGMIILSTRAATREWEAALDDVTGVLETNGQTLDVTTEAGRANQAMLDTVASSALDLAAAVYEETKSEEAFRASLAGSRESLVQTGIRFGLSQEAAETFADSVLNVPSAAVVNVSTPGSAEALREIGLLAQRISALTDKKISIELATSLVNQERAQAARGGLMPARNAAGGYIAGPGTRTSDDILSWLSNGEYVIKASSVDKYGASFLDAVNAGRFAGGGPVGRRLEVATSTGDFGALVTGINALVAQGELAAARSLPPVFGGDERGAATPSGRGGLGPAAARARQYVIDAFGVTNIGGYSNRNIAGTNKLSKHALGKAIDVMTGRNMALGQQVANAFYAQRGAFGVDNIIWNRRITNAGRGWQWGPYNGANPHTDHPHIDFYAQGGRVGSASNPHLRDAGGPLLPGCTFDPTTKETPA